ncbi:DUF7768 domain-containing protein [Ochrobactrum sp. BTU1]|uniref:DUF7768 domain-containing protein n=1 Tax=Ochrobactrum sp. BTU1 TaxID=2840456 RepID=UPI001C0525A0|nr:hypothetical protein KMS41_16320 [Ochrobactrum sp. BTU1]
MELHQLYGVNRPGDEWIEGPEDKAARAAVEGRTVAEPTTRITFGANGIALSTRDEDGVWHDVPWVINLAPVKQPSDLVIIETPYSGDVEANTAYARACLLDSLRRGEAPIASHLLHTQVLDDMQPDERSLGIEAGIAWYRVATKCVVYTDRGISAGMKMGIDRAGLHGVPVEYRSIENRAAA